MNELKIEDYREHYNLYFKEFHRLAVGEFADLSYGNDKPNDTASSLESIIAYANYILKQGKDNPIMLNAGSGASSFVFRKIFSHVIDNDPNTKYNRLVNMVCEVNGLYCRDIFTGFGTLYGFSDVYYDYGSIERLPFLGRAIEVATKSIYVDDADNRECCIPYRTHVQELCKSMGLKCFDCIEALDEHGRFGIIIEK